MNPKFGICLASVLLLLTTAACGGSDSSEKGGDDIKIWMINPLTRGGSLTPSMPPAAEAAIKAINADGGIDGRKIVMKSCDTQGDPNQAARCGREAVEGGAVAVVGTLAANHESGSYVPILESAGIPIVGGHPISGPDLTSKNMFPMDGGTPITVAGEAAAILKAGSKKPSFIGQDSDAWPQILSWLNLGLEPQGAKLNKNVRVPANAPDLAPYAASVLAGGTDGVMMAFGETDFVKTVKAIRAAGSDVPIATIGAASTSESAIKALGADAEGIVSVSLCKPETMTDDPDVKTFLDAMKKYSPDAQPDAFAEMAYSAVYLFKHAAEEADEITPKGILTALESVKGFDTGVCGELSYDKPLTEFKDIPRMFKKDLIFTQIKDGKLVPISPEFVPAF